MIALKELSLTPVFILIYIFLQWATFPLIFAIKVNTRINLAIALIVWKLAKLAFRWLQIALLALKENLITMELAFLFVPLILIQYQREKSAF